MRRPFILCLIIILLAACRADVQPAPTITAAPVDTPTFTVTPSPGNNATALANARGTAIATLGWQSTRDIEALTPSPTQTPHESPTTTLTPLPTPTYYPSPTPQPFPANSGALPNGAVDRIGIGFVRDSAVSPDGRQVAFATSTGLYLYHIEDLILVWRRYLINPASTIDWSSDGSMLLTSHQGSEKAILWDATTAERIQEYPDILFGAVWSPDTLLFAAPTPPFRITEEGAFSVLPNNIGLFDREGQQTHTLESGETGFWGWAFNTVVWSPDGEYIAATMKDDSHLYVWHMASEALIHKVDLSTWSDWWWNITFSPDSRFAAVYDSQFGATTVPVVDIQSGTIAFSLNQAEEIEDVQWSPDDTQIIMVGSRQTTFWNASTHELEASLDYPAFVTEWSSDNSKVALAGNGSIRVLDSTGDMLSLLPLPTRELPWEGATRIHWLPDNQHILITNRIESQELGNIQDIILWDTTSGDVKGGLQPSLDIQRAVWTPDSRYLVLEMPSRFAVWDAFSHEVLLDPPDDLNPLDSYFSEITAQSTFGALGWRGDDILSPNGEWRAEIEMQGFCGDGPWGGGCYLDNGLVRTVEVSTGRAVMEQTFLTEGITAVAWSPLGNMLALAFGHGYEDILNNTALIIDPFTGEVIREIVGHSSFIGWLAFSPLEDRLASVSADGTVIIWDLTR